MTESQNWFRYSVCLVRVSEGGGWLSKLRCVPKNCLITPITLDFNPFSHQIRPQAISGWLQGESQNWFRYSVSLVRMSGGVGWLSDLPCVPNKYLRTPNNFGFQFFLPSNQATVHQGQIRPQTHIYYREHLSSDRQNLAEVPFKD